MRTLPKYPNRTIAIIAMLLIVFCTETAFAISGPSLLSKGDHIAAVSGTHIWYRVKGRGPLLFVISTQYGIGTSYLQRGLRPLEDRFTVVYVDLRGNGHSDIPSDLSTISTRRDVEDLEE